MKKLLFILPILFLYLRGTAQFNQPNIQQGTANVITENRGAFYPRQSIIVPTVDTLDNPATVYRGALTRRPQDSLLYMSDGVFWHPFLGGSPVPFSDSVYVNFPLGVRWDTIGGTLHQVIFIRAPNGLVNGGIVTQHDCWTVDVTAPIVNINFKQYVGAPITLTIDSSDATLNRYDRIVMDTLEHIFVIKGELSMTPSEPGYNSASQVSIALKYIPAGSTCLDVTTKVIFDGIGDNPSQWDTAKVGTITPDFSSITNPYHLNQALFISTYTDSSQLVFTHTGQTDTVTSSSVLKDQKYLNNPFTNQLFIQFWYNDTAVSANTLVNSFMNLLDTGQYQINAVPFSAFGFTSSFYNKIVYTLHGQDISGAGGLYLDWIQIQNGINQSTQNNYVDSTNVIGGFLYDYYKGIAVRRNAVGGGGSALDNLGSGYRLLANDATAIKTLFGVGITPDSTSNGGAITLTQGQTDWNQSDNTQWDYIKNKPTITAGTVTNVAALTLGTTGTDLTSSVANPTTTPVITLNVPTASATNRGALSSSDWTTFNNKQATISVTAPITLTGASVGIVNQGTATQVLHGNASGNASFGQIVNGDITNATIVASTKLSATGTPSSTTYLRGDDTWATVSSGGADSAIWKNSATYTAGNKVLTMGNSNQTFSGNVVNFDSTKTGTQGTLVGTVLAQPFTSSLPATFTSSVTTATITYPGTYLNVTGGDNSANNYLQAVAYYNYDKQKISIVVIPQDKSATTYGIGLTQGSNATSFSGSYLVKWILTSGSDSGRVYNNGSYSPNMAFSIGDTLLCEFERDGWQFTASMLNKTTGKKTSITISSGSSMGTGGLTQLLFYGGTQRITKFTVESFNLKNTGVAIGGDSQSAATGPTIEANMWPNLVLLENKYRYSNYSHPSICTDKWLISDWPNVKVQNPQYLIFSLGYNDRRDLADDSALFKLRVTPLLDSASAAGITVIICNIVPTIVGSTQGAATDKCSVMLQNLATNRGLRFVDVRTPLLNGLAGLYKNYVYSDAVHMSDSGHIVYSNAVKQLFNDGLNQFVGDTTSPVKMYNLPSASLVPAGLNGLNLTGVDSKGNVYKIPNTLPTVEGWTVNKFSSVFNYSNSNYGFGNSQANSSVYTSGPVVSDSALIVSHSQGLRIGFAYGTSNTSGANIDITNGIGAFGGGFQGWDNMSGSGNIKIIASSAAKTKGSMAGTISGTNNTLLNAHLTSTLSGANNTGIGDANFAVTSGNNNIAIGAGAISGVTTGSSNLHLVTGGTNDGITGNVASTVVLGNNANRFNYQVASDDIVFYGQHLWLGGKSDNPADIDINVPSAKGNTNYASFNGLFTGSISTGVAEAGKWLFRYSTPTTTGSTLQSSFTSTMQVERKGVAIGSTVTTFTKATDAVLDVQSTTQSFLKPRMTTTQRDALGGVLTIVNTGVGSGYTNGRVALTISGGGGTGAAGNVTIASGLVNASSIVITEPGTGYTSAPTVTVTSGGGSGATFTATAGNTAGGEVYNSTLKTNDLHDGTGWRSQPNGLSGSASLDFGSVASLGNAELTITVTGAADGDAVMIGIPNASFTAGLVFTGRVSATNTVSIQCYNSTLGAIDPASGTFKVFVQKN